MAVTPKIESANGSGRSTAKLPMRGRKKGKGSDPKGPTPIHKGRKIDGALQENILTLLCCGDNSEVEQIIARVPTELFGNEVYRVLADRAIAYFKKYDKAPADHLPDVVADFLTSGGVQARQYTDLLHDIHASSKGINGEFVLDALQEFVLQQSLRQSITFAAEELKKGHLDSAQRTMLECGQAHQVSSIPLTPIRTVQNLMNAEIPALQEIFYPVLQSPAIMLLLGSRGSFKTHFAMAMALAAASGKDLFTWRCDKKCRVLFLDFEMQLAVGKQRFKMLQKSLGLKPEDEMLDVWYASDNPGKAIPNVSDKKQTGALIEQCSKYDLVFLDNIGAACRGVDLNKAEEIESIRDLVTGLQYRNTSSVIVAHLGKDPSRGARGSSAIEDLPDCILKLKSKETSRGNNLIKVSQTKTRHHSPSEFGSFQVSVDSSYNGLDIKHQTIRESKSQLVENEYLHLLEDGLVEKGTQKALGKQFGVSKSTVSAAAAKATRNFKKQEKTSARKIC